MNKKYVKIITIFATAIIIALCVGFLSLSFWTTGIKVPLQNASINFGETEWVFKLKKGTPSESEDSVENESSIFTYSEEIMSSYKAKIDYWFVNSNILPFDGRLYKAEYSIETQNDLNDAAFDRIVEILIDEYSYKKVIILII